MLADLVGWAVGTLAALFILYVIVMRLARKRDRGELKRTDKVVGAIVVPAGIFLDAAWNLTFATLVFWDFPQEWLLTARLKRYRRDEPLSWRGKIAAFVCGKWLNPHDPGHC